MEKMNRNILSAILISLALFPSLSRAEKSFTEADGTASVNGKEVKAKHFIFETKLVGVDAPSMPDKLSLEIDESGFVRLRTQMYQGGHLFGSGEVDKFIQLLKQTKKAAKDARFTKQAGDFRLGDIAGKIILTMSTSSGGNLKYFSLITKSDFPQPRVTEHQITQTMIDDMISILAKKDKAISGLSGETKEVRVVKISMSEIGGVGAKGGLSLKIAGQGGGSTTLSVEDVGFTLKLSKADKSKAKEGLSQALQYLKTANRTYKDMPDKKFKINGLGKKTVNATVEAFDGNSDRYQFTMKVAGDGEDTERWVVITQEQLAKLVSGI